MLRHSFFAALTVLFVFMGITLIHAQDTVRVIPSGSQVVPPVNTTGTGMLTVIKSGDSLTVKGSFQELTSYYTGAYIQMARRGEEGNMLFQLNATDLNKDHTAGRFKASENTFKLTEPIEKFYRKDMLYINIATNEHPSGEIRGQIVS